MAGKSTSVWMLTKLITAVLFTFSVCFLGLFFATLAGLYKTSYPGWQFLNAEPELWTGAQLAFQAALWLGVYLFASRRIQRQCNGI